MDSHRILEIAGQAGEVRVVEMNGYGRTWGSSLEGQLAGLDDVMSRATASTLVADIDLRH